MKMKKKVTQLNIKGFTSIILILVLCMYFLYSVKQNSFNGTLFKSENVYKYVEELSSPVYEGRRAGTRGNQLALEYIEKFFRDIGIEPAGENGSYYQNVNTMLPVYNSEPRLDLVDSSGKIIERFKVGVDFREVITGYGGVGQATGGIINANKTLTGYSKEELKGKMVLLRIAPQDKEIEYAIQSGASGIVYFGAGVETIGFPNMSGKPGKTIILTKVSRDAYEKLVSYSGKEMMLKADYDINFQVKNSPNILGKIEGRNKDSGYTIISASIDGYGSEFDGRYFPGAVDNASGAAFMMEMARSIKSQGTKPEKTIIFVGWNDSIDIGRLSGMRYYAENPIYPLNKSKVIMFERLGGVHGGFTVIDYNEAPGKALAQKLVSLSEDPETLMKSTAKYSGLPNDVFAKKGVPAVILEQSYLGTGDNLRFGTYEDKPDSMDLDQIKMASQIPLGYIKMELYKDVFTGLLSPGQSWATMIFLLGILIIYFIELLYKFNSNFRLGKFKLEDIYYSVAFNLIKRFYKLMVPFVIVLLALAFISHVPSNFNIYFGRDGAFINISLSQVLKKSIAHMENLLTNGLGKSTRGYPAMEVVWYSFQRSFIMVLLTTILSFILGIWRGVTEGFKQKERGNFKIIKTLSLLSLPDVFIVLIVQLLLVFIYEKGLWNPIIEYIDSARFIIPFLCLSIIPTIYIAQIAYVAAREEMKKDYIRAARAKGLSRSDILRKHLLKGVVMKVVDSMQSVLSIIVSNLIIVETMFGYPSISSNLMNYMKERDINVAVGLVLAFGFIYLFFTLLFKLVSRLINPFKKEGIN